jgi:multicomponent Na+:H+ antiporter subunit D
MIGVFPSLLYSLLPFVVDYHAYTVDHVLVQLQMLIFGLLAFVFLMKSGIRSPEIRGTNIDTDVIYRKWLPAVFPGIVGAVVSANAAVRRRALAVLGSGYGSIERLSRPGAPLARGWSVASMMFIVIVLMFMLLVLNLL